MADIHKAGQRQTDIKSLEQIEKLTEVKLKTPCTEMPAALNRSRSIGLRTTSRNTTWTGREAGKTVGVGVGKIGVGLPGTEALLAAEASVACLPSLVSLSSLAFVSSVLLQ